MAAVLVEGFVAVRRCREPCDVLADGKCYVVDLLSIRIEGVLNGLTMW